MWNCPKICTMKVTQITNAAIDMQQQQRKTASKCFIAIIQLQIWQRGGRTRTQKCVKCRTTVAQLKKCNEYDAQTICEKRPCEYAKMRKMSTDSDSVAKMQ